MEYIIEEKIKYIIGDNEFDTRKEAEDFIKDCNLIESLSKYEVDNSLEESLKIPYQLYRHYFPVFALADTGFKVYKANNSDELDEIFKCIRKINKLKKRTSKSHSRIDFRTTKESISYPKYIWYNKFYGVYQLDEDIIHVGTTLYNADKEFIDKWDKFITVVNNISEK